MNQRKSILLVKSWIALILFLSLALAVVPGVHSQDPAASPSSSPSPTSSVDKVGLQQALLDLNSPWTVMCVAAHPDDEDGTTLTVLRRKYGVHTVSLFSTYGEGGQNAVGPELYEELGVIRADETRKAAKIQGSEAYFLGLRDFGFSKSADEAFKIWGHDEALRRMVLKIRELRPDVIITNHDTTSGHGHHQATGRLVLEAFDAAADPQRFPEQLSQASVWRTKRLFVRARRAPADTTSPENLVVIDPNEQDPLRGSSYGEQALTGLQQHASQGPWPKTVADWLRAQNNQTGKLNPIRYRLVKESSGSASSIAAPSTIPFVAGLKLSSEMSVLLKILDGNRSLVDEPDRLLEKLIELKASLSRTSINDADKARFSLFASRLDQALAVATSTKLTVSLPRSTLVPGKTGRLIVNLSNSGTEPLRIHELAVLAWENKIPLEAAELLLPDTETSLTVDLPTPKAAAFTLPKADHLYDGLLQGTVLTATADLNVEGARFTVRREISVDLAPLVEIQKVEPNPIVLTPGMANRPLVLSVTLKNNSASEFGGVLKISSPGVRIFEFGKEIKLAPDESKAVMLEVNATPARSGQRPLPTEIPATITVEPTDATEVIARRVVPIVGASAVVAPHLRVGYIPSFDASLETALSALGVDARKLTVEDVQKNSLAIYDTIIIDNRGYEAHPELITNNDVLLKYVEDGGTLLVFYHKDNEWNPDEKRGRPQLAPLPIILGGERVTEEDAPVHFRVPGHRLLNFPNKIKQADFQGWIQERGLYYPKEWDPKYVMLLSTHDTGEKPLYGGLLVTKYGRGNYLYTSMVWYRQLRAGVPGGYRMFANMISYGKR